MAAARQFNVVVKADGTALDNIVAANDFIFFEGWDSLRATVPARTVDIAASGALDTDSLTAIAAVVHPPTNVALPNIPVYMVDTAGSPVTGLTLTVTRSIDGGAFGAATGTAAEISAGCYQFDASAADMNGGVIIFKFVGTGAVTRIIPIITDAAY